jgi:hypothetical protein
MHEMEQHCCHPRHRFFPPKKAQAVVKPTSRRFLFSRTRYEILSSKMVGGPGFEPGASRSRNLGDLIHRGRFGCIWVHLADAPADFEAD